MDQRSNTPSRVLARYRDELRAQRGIGIRTFAAGFIDQYEKLVPLHERIPLPADTDPTDRAEKLGDRFTRALNPDDPRNNVALDWLPAWVLALEDQVEGMGVRALDEMLQPAGIRVVRRRDVSAHGAARRAGSLAKEAGEAISAMTQLESLSDRAAARRELEDVIRAARSAIEQIERPGGQVQAVK